MFSHSYFLLLADDFDDITVDVINNLSLPDGISLHRAIPKGTPGAGKSVKYQFWLDNAKSKEVLGLTYRSMEETTLDSLVDYKAKGWLTQ